MEAEFWHQRWRDGLIGFHQPLVNAQLKAFWPTLEVPPDSHVLVPLCGKSLDLGWLSRDYRVCGVELSPQAIEAFSAEQGMAGRRYQSGKFDICEDDRIRLFCGDFFDLTAAQCGPIAAVYDRAALVALPPAMRSRYAEHFHSLCGVGTRMLLISMAYPQADMDGPPFSVEADEVRALFGDHWQVETLQTRDLLASEAKFAERGLRRLEESVYRLTKLPVTGD